MKVITIASILVLLVGAAMITGYSPLATADENGNPYKEVVCTGSIDRAAGTTNGIKFTGQVCRSFDPCHRIDALSLDILEKTGVVGMYDNKGLLPGLSSRSQQIDVGFFDGSDDFQIKGCTADTTIKLRFDEKEGSFTESVEVKVQ